MQDLQKYREIFREIFFPTQCIICGAYGEWWCKNCRSHIEIAKRFDIRPLPALDGVMCMGFYHDPKLRNVIHRLKYFGGTCVLPDIVSAFSEVCQHVDFPWKNEMNLHIQPLITTPRRIRERGFDQAELLAYALQLFIAPYAHSAHILIRQDTAIAQATIHKDAERIANVRNMFCVRDVLTIPESILLIDDIITSGSTMLEAARVLREAGVKRIYGFALALGK